MSAFTFSLNIKHNSFLMVNSQALRLEKRNFEQKKAIIPAALARSEHLENAYANGMGQGAKEIRLEELKRKGHISILLYPGSLGNGTRRSPAAHLR